MNICYETCVEPYRDKYQIVIIPSHKIAMISDLVDQIVKAKKYEHQHVIDHKRETKRFTTGLLGEAAVEQLLGTFIIDWEAGNSSNYNNPDMHKTGVKTCEYGKFPIIFKKNEYSQIICLLTGENEVLVCGLARPEILNRYQSDDLILSTQLRAKGTKTGFYGFRDLIAIKGREQ